MAGKVLWHVTMSLDGFISGSNDSIDWVFEYESEPSPDAIEVIGATGAILAGRRWWDAAEAKYDGPNGIYGGAWVGPVFVLTNRKTETHENPRLVFTSNKITEAVAPALDAAQGKNDEILIHIVPVLLGDGVRLIENHSVQKTKMETISVVRSGQITDIRFRVLK
jgi:dihydrofolate reductase